MVQIQSSWFPLVDRNPQKFLNIYTAKDSDYQKASIRIYHDAKIPLELPYPSGKSDRGNLTRER